MRKFSSFLAAVSAALLISLSAGAQTTDPHIPAVENGLMGPFQIVGENPWTIQERMAFWHVKALSIAVIQDYKIAWAKAYGWADDSLKIPATTQTLFQAASISKSLNAVGVMKLVQEKKIDLYADINTYLTTWKFPYDSLSRGKKISTANLLSHTAGLRVHGFPGYARGTQIPSLVSILNGDSTTNTDTIKSMYEPGLKSEYSGGGIEISQMIVMDVTHQPYDQYMYDQVLKPMGMISSTYQQPPLNKNPTLLATAYKEDGTQIIGKYHVYPEQAAAGLWTNPTDLSKYIIETQLALIGKSHKVLDQPTTVLRLTPYIDQSAALGVFIVNADSTKYFNHSGANEGFRCVYFGSMEGGNGIVVMVNSDNNDILNEVVRSVAKEYKMKGLFHPRPKQKVQIPDSVLQTYAGNYELGPKFILTISVEGGKVYAQATGQNKFDIVAESQNKFFATIGLIEIEFVKDEQGKVSKLILYQNGQREAKKL